MIIWGARTVSDLHRAKSHDENSNPLTFSQCSRIIKIALLWDPPEAAFEARIQVRVVYLGSSSRDHESGNGKRDRDKKEPIKQGSTVDNWSITLLRNSGKHHECCVRVIPTERQEDHSLYPISHWVTAAGGMSIPSPPLAYRWNGLQWPRSALSKDS